MRSCSAVGSHDPWTLAAIAIGRGATALSRYLGLGLGSVAGGRVALALRPGLLRRLSTGRTTVVVTGTNGKTTTSHLVAALLAERGPVAHNASGSNMLDGAAAALIAAPRARHAVLEIDERHVPAALGVLGPAVLVLLNLTRDQLDRVTEVRATAAALRTVLPDDARTTVVANADDPMVTWAAGNAGRHVVWVSVGTLWSDDTHSCPACGGNIERRSSSTASREDWWCTRCPLRRPRPGWQLDTHEGTATIARRGAVPVPVEPALPGRVNLANAAVALVAVAQLGVEPSTVAPALKLVTEVSGRYGVIEHRGRRLRTLLVKNPAGWVGAVDMLAPERSLFIVVNAREADGRDVSWLWDLPLDPVRDRRIVVAGERATDLGVRLAYDQIDYRLCVDPVAAIEHLPVGEVDVIANYTAFHDLRRHLAARGERGELSAG